MNRDGFGSGSLLESGGSLVEAMGYGPSDDFLLSSSWGCGAQGAEQRSPLGPLAWVSRREVWGTYVISAALQGGAVTHWGQVLGHWEPEVPW